MGLKFERICCRKACLYAAALFLGTVSWFPALIWADELNNTAYDVYEGDVDGDGYTDVYFSRVPDFIPIVSSGLLIPITVEAVGSYLLTGKSDGSFNAPVVDETVSVSGLTKLASSALEFGDFNADGLSDATLTGGLSVGLTVFGFH